VLLGICPRPHCESLHCSLDPATVFTGFKTSEWREREGLRVHPHKAAVIPMPLSDQQLKQDNGN